MNVNDRFDEFEELNELIEKKKNKKSKLKITKVWNEYRDELKMKMKAGRCYKIENITKEDILNLGEFEYIINENKDYLVMIRKKCSVVTVFDMPILHWEDGYEIIDKTLGVFPETYSADEVLEKLKDYKKK